MSLQIAANHLASKGRGPDSQLVHMAPTEVAGLQALAKAHGGSLTINPETGLPEAGFLSNILPMVIGAGLSVASGGTLTPMMAGLMTGAGYGLIKGDLKAGLMAGLGAYGGAGMMGSVLGAGAGAAQEAALANVGADTTAASMGAQNAGQLGAGFEQAMAQQGVASAPAANFASTGVGAGQYGLGPATAAPTQLPAMQTPATLTQMPTQAAVANQAAANATNQYMQSGFMDQMKGGIGALAQDPSKLMTGANLKYGLAAAAPAMMATPEQAEYKGDSEQAKYTYSPGRVETPAPGATSSSERQWFTPSYTRVMAEGGPVAAMSARNEDMTLLANGGQQFADGGDVSYTFDPATQRYNKPASAQAPSALSQLSKGNQLAYGLITNSMGPIGSVAGDAIAAQLLKRQNAANPTTQYTFDPKTQQYGKGMADGGAIPAAKGRFLRGPGDGVSDSIPATIGGNQPARLADGEFVVPARIVSELGNGSSEAGARKLYAMMDRVQKARGKTVGKNKVATDSKAEKMLPA